MSIHVVRYEACICYHNKIETVTSGVLEPLAMHSPKIKALCSKGSDETFKLQPPENLNDAKWFTRSALMRFVLPSPLLHNAVCGRRIVKM